MENNMYSERFNKAYNALVDAFFNGTLAKGDCNACAVGNIVASGIGADIILGREEDGEEIEVRCESDVFFWKYLFVTSRGGQEIDTYSKYEIDGDVLKRRLLDATGYHASELARVEYAFEMATKIGLNRYHQTSEQQILEDQFNGLQAVMDVLIELENITDGQPLKDKFKEHPRLVLANQHS